MSVFSKTQPMPNERAALRLAAPAHLATSVSWPRESSSFMNGPGKCAREQPASICCSRRMADWLFGLAQCPGLVCRVPAPLALVSLASRRPTTPKEERRANLNCNLVAPVAGQRAAAWLQIKSVDLGAAAGVCVPKPAAAACRPSAHFRFASSDPFKTLFCPLFWLPCIAATPVGLWQPLRQLWGPQLGAGAGALQIVGAPGAAPRRRHSVLRQFNLI